MSSHTNHGYPVKRTGFIQAVAFVGDDDHLDLEVQYPNALGNPTTMTIPLERNPIDPDDKGQMCLVSSKGINDLSHDAIMSSLRMGTLIGDVTPRSTEWMNKWVDEGATSNIQTAIGTVKVVAIRGVGDGSLEIDVIKSGATSIVRTIVTDYDELRTYAYAPATQLLSLAGAVEKQYPSYVHNPAGGTVLTTQQKADIVAFLLAHEPWI